MSDSGADFFSNGARTLLPEGGYFVSFATVYIDESGTHEGSDVMCLAGFLYERDHAILLDREWREVLARENMPYMRMSLFNNGRRPFDHLSDPRRIEIGKQLIDIISRHRTLAFASGVNEKEHESCFRQYVAPERFKHKRHSAYVECLYDCLGMIRFWADANGFEGDISYIFEAGHADQSAANESINLVLKMPQTIEKIRYAGHSFLPKIKAIPLQSADMLAWLSYKWFLKRRVEKVDKMRRDLEALIANRFPHQRFSAHLWNEEMARRSMIATVERMKHQPMRFYYPTLRPS
jgi:hypothetical protein